MREITTAAICIVVKIHSFIFNKNICTFYTLKKCQKTRRINMFDISCIIHSLRQLQAKLHYNKICLDGKI